MQTENPGTRTQDSENIKNEIERDIANDTAAKLAVENTTLAEQRDRAIDLAAIQAQQSTQAQQNASVAVAAATLEADQRTEAERQAALARVREQQAWQETNRLATEQSLLRSDLASEREAASNASFGFVFLTCIILAVLIGLGLWLYTSNNSASNRGATNQGTTQTSSTSMNGTNVAPTWQKQNPPAVIVRENPSVVVVPVPSPPATANRPQPRSDSVKASGNLQRTAPAHESSNSSTDTNENPNGSTSENTNQENSTNSSDG